MIYVLIGCWDMGIEGGARPLAGWGISNLLIKWILDK